MSTKQHLFIFDLDDTLVPEISNKVYPQIKSILDTLSKHNVVITLASYNDNADYFLNLNNITHYFSHLEFFRDRNKKKHIANILRKFNGIPKKNIHFFDDSKANTDFIKSYFGIHTTLIDGKKGVTNMDVIDSLIKSNKNKAPMFADFFLSIFV